MLIRLTSASVPVLTDHRSTPHCARIGAAWKVSAAASARRDKRPGGWDISILQRVWSQVDCTTATKTRGNSTARREQHPRRDGPNRQLYGSPQVTPRGHSTRGGQTS